jgi:hypothetical protein
MMNYCNRIESFINMHHLIQKILVETILDVHVRGVKIKKFLYPDVVTMYLLQKKKRFYIEILVLVFT